MKTSRNYIIEQVVVNFVLNFAIAYYLGRTTLAHQETIPLWADQAAPLDPNMAGDILIGSFILSFLVTLILSAITRYHLSKQNVDTNDLVLGKWLKRLPNSLFKRSLVMGLMAMITAGLVSVLLLYALNITAVDSGYYTITHSCYAAILASCIAYSASKRALVD